MALDEKLLALWHSRHGNKWSKIASEMPGCCVTSLKNLYYNTARACLRSRPVNRGTFLFEYVLLVRDNPDDDDARLAAYEQVCQRLGTPDTAAAAIAAEGALDADAAAGVCKPPRRRPQQKRVRRKPRRSAAATATSSESGESDEEQEEDDDERDDSSTATSSGGSESEEEEASEPEEEESEETEDDEDDEDFLVARRRPRKGALAGSRQRERPSKAADGATAARAAAGAVGAAGAALRRKLGRQGSDNASGSSTNTDASANDQLAVEAAAAAFTTPGVAETGAGRDCNAAPQPRQQPQPQLPSRDEDVAMAMADEPIPDTAAVAGAAAAAAAAAAEAEAEAAPSSIGRMRAAEAADCGDAGAAAAVAVVEPMDGDDDDNTPRAAAEAAAAVLGSAVAVHPLHMQVPPPQPQPHSCTSSPLPPRFGARSMPAPGGMGRLDSTGRRQGSGLASGGFFGEGHAAGGFDGEGHAAGGSFDGSGGHGAMHGHGHGHVLRATGSTSTAAHAGPDAHTLEHMQSPSPATYMGRRAFSCDGRAALPMPTSVSGSATAAASTGMAPPPFTPAASCDALYNTVRDQRQQQRPAKPLEDFFTAAHQGPVAGCHGHASAGEFGYGRQQQHQQHKQLHLHLHLHQQHQHLHLQQQQQQQRLSGAGPSRMQPLQMQQHPREPPPALGSGSGSHSHLGQQPLPQAQSVRQMQLQPYPQPPSAGSSMCHADTSGTLSTLHSTGDGGSGRVLLCSLPELPGGKRLSLTTAAASGSLPAAATSPCLLGSPRPGGDGDNEALEGLLHSLERDLGIMSPAHPHRHHQHQQLQPLQPTQSSLPQLLPHPRSVGSDSNSGAHPHLLPLSGPQPHQPHPHPQPSHSHSQQPQDAAAGLPWLVREASDAPDEMLCGSGGVGGKSPRRKLQGLPPSQQQLPQHDDPHQGDVHVARRTDPGIMHRHDSAVWGARDMRREQEPSLQLQPPQRDGRGNGMCGPAAGGLRGVAFEGALAGAGPRAAGSQDWPGGSGDGFTPRSTADGYAAQPPPFNGQAGDASAGGGHRHFCPVHGSPFATSAGPWSQQAPLDSRGSGGGAVGPLSGGGGSAAWGGQHPHHPPSHPHHPHHHHHHHLRQHPHQHPHPHHAHLPHCPLHQPHCPLHRHAHAHALSGAHSMPQPLPSYGRDCWPTLLPEGGGGGFAADGSAMELSAMQLRSQQQPYGGQQQPYGQQQLAGGGGSGGSGSRHHAAGPGPGSRLTSARVGPYPRGTQPGGPHSPFSAAGAVRSSAGYDGLRGSGGGAGPAGGLFGPEAPRQQPMPMHGSHMEWASAPTVSFAQGPHNHHQHQPHHNQYQNHHHQQHLRGSSVPRCYSLQNFEDAGPSRLLQPLQPLQPLQQPLLQPLQQQQQQQSAAADLHTTPNLFEGALQREPSIPHSTMNPSSISNGCAGGPGRGTSMDVGGRFLVEHADCVTSDTDLDLLVDNLIWNPAPEASWISR